MAGLLMRFRGRATGAGDAAVIAEAEQVAAVVRRLAVLLRAGLHPERAWQQLAPPGDRARRTDDAVSAVVREVAGGSREERLAERIHRAAGSVAAAGHGETARSWRVLAAALEVADLTGAPLAAAFERLADTLIDVGRVRREAGTALAGPVATGRTVLLLPAGGLLLGSMLGFDPVRILTTTVAGAACLAAGVALVVTGWWWNRRLVRQAMPDDPAPGLVLDLVATAMSGGGSVPRATAAVRQACLRVGIDASAGLDATAAVVEVAARTGAPVALLLRGEADRVRRDEATWADRAAVRLAARLMLPLGVCILPAFLAVGVVPLLMAVVSSTLGRA